MVAGARGDQAGVGTLPERLDLLQSSAELERTGHLQALGLQRNACPGDLGQIVAGDRRRAHGDRPERLHLCYGAARLGRGRGRWRGFRRSR